MAFIPLAHTNRPRILIVEDDEMQMEVLQSALATAGFEVDTISGGLAAIWKVREGRYDVVLLDYQLPEIDGLVAAKLVGDLMGFTARPILIALTATPRILNEREGGGESAFDVVVGKSSDFASLISIIKSHLDRAPSIADREGAEFLLALDDWSDYDAESHRPMAKGEGPEPARILVVEDDEVQRLILTSVFEQQGYIVHTASNGLDAVRSIREGSFDLALVDYNLPEIDGLAVAKLVHELMRDAARPRLIALTATPTRLRDHDVMAKSVFDEIIGKSDDLHSLIGSVDHLLTRRNGRDTIEYASDELV